MASLSILYVKCVIYCMRLVPQYSPSRKQSKGQVWWFIPVTPATLEAKVGGSWFEASWRKIA
jgi:hypothetical protein